MNKSNLIILLGFQLNLLVLCGLAQDGDCALDCMVDDVLDLKFVLVVRVPLCEVPELLREVEAVARVLRRDEVLGNFDAVVQVAHLMGGTRRDENCVPFALNDGVT